MPQKISNVQKIVASVTLAFGDSLRIIARRIALVTFVTIPFIAACSSSQVVTPTRFVPIPTPLSPTASRTVTPTFTPTVPPIPILEPLAIPTPPAGGTLLSLSSDSNFTGWISSKESGISAGDSTLRAGVFQGQSYASLLRFDLRNLAPGSRILFGVLEITGSEAKNVGAGQWALELLDSNDLKFDNLTFDTLKNAKALSTIGSPLTAKDLAVGLTNRFIFSANDLAFAEKQLDNGLLTMRLNGPSTGDNNLFMWNAGSGSKMAILYIVTIPGKFVVITDTPAPNNVFAAATLSANQTLQARQFGTSTPLPRIFVTATPGGQALITNPDVIVTPVPTPVDPAQATATAVYATAVAATTGTFTPFPSSFVTATPPPIFIPVEKLTPTLTVTPGTAQVSTVELARTPLPSGLYNKILFLEGPRANPNIWVMNPDGTILGLLTDHKVFDIAKARDTISPDGVRYVYQVNAPEGGYQLLMKDLNFPNAPSLPITSGGRVVFGQAWSPDGKKIAYVSEQFGHQDIFEYSVDTRAVTKLTSTSEGFWNQFPSYSPDGKQIVFSSDRGHPSTFSEIWVMNADGTKLIKLGNGVWDAYNPVWIKWQK